LASGCFPSARLEIVAEPISGTPPSSTKFIRVPRRDEIALPTRTRKRRHISSWPPRPTCGYFFDTHNLSQLRVQKNDSPSKLFAATIVPASKR
jgi:hypothetical protein